MIVCNTTPTIWYVFASSQFNGDISGWECYWNIQNIERYPEIVNMKKVCIQRDHENTNNVWNSIYNGGHGDVKKLVGGYF